MRLNNSVQSQNKMVISRNGLASFCGRKDNEKYEVLKVIYSISEVVNVYIS